MKTSIKLYTHADFGDYFFDKRVIYRERSTTWAVCKAFIRDQFPLVFLDKSIVLTISSRKLINGVRVHLSFEDGEILWSLNCNDDHQCIHFHFERVLKPFLGKKTSTWVWVRIENCEEA